MSFYVLKKINKIQVAGLNFWLIYMYLEIVKPEVYSAEQE